MNNDLIRCFIAATIPKTVLLEIEKYSQDLKRIAPDVRWVKAKGIHLTLKFLGEINATLLAQVRESLLSIKEIVNPFPVNIQGAGCFPTRKRPRVFWLGLEQDKSNSLTIAQQWIEDRLYGLGFEKEKRPFSPHLTLGRVKKPQDFTHLFKYLDKHPFEKVSFTIEDIVLMQSILKPSGAEYVTVQVYRL
jgi:2'-5' RNA ligase